MNSLSHITAAGRPAGRAEDEVAVAAASGYRRARRRQGRRTEPERRRRGRLPGGRGSWPLRPLGREKVLLRPPGPAEQVPPGREEVGGFTLPVHSQLGPSPNFLFPSALWTPPRGPAGRAACVRRRSAQWLDRRADGRGSSGRDWEASEKGPGGQKVSEGRVRVC